MDGNGLCHAFSHFFFREGFIFPLESATSENIMLHWPPTKEDIPNLLTASRLLVLPPIILLMLIPQAWASWLVLFLYVPAAVSDYLDGYYARLYKKVSPIGVFLDPISDKIFVGAILFMMVATHRLDRIWAICGLLIMMREIFISGLREFLGNKEIKLPVTSLAKWKTGVQMTAIGFLIMWPFVGPDWFQSVVEGIGKIGILIAAGLTVKTGWDYTKAAWPYLNEKPSE
jgi:cardiolipin synthase